MNPFVALDGLALETSTFHFRSTVSAFDPEFNLLHVARFARTRRIDVFRHGDISFGIVVQMSIGRGERAVHPRHNTTTSTMVCPGRDALP